MLPAIRLYRNMTGIGIKEAKDAIEATSLYSLSKQTYTGKEYDLACLMNAIRDIEEHVYHVLTPWPDTGNMFTMLFWLSKRSDDAELLRCTQTVIDYWDRASDEAMPGAYDKWFIALDNAYRQYRSYSL